MKCLYQFPSWPLTILVTIFVACLLTLPRLASEPTGYLKGDSVYYAAAVASLWWDGDLDLTNQYFPNRPLSEVLPTLTGDYGGEYGWASGGYLTLKQSPLFALAALPCYAVFGTPGFLFFNTGMIVFLVAGIAQLGGGSSIARLVALVALLTTPVRHFIFDFSPDLFLTNLLMASMLLARRGHAGWAGLVAGLAVSAKLYVVVLLLPVPLLVFCCCPHRWRALAVCVGMGVAGLLPMFICNTVQYGSPLVSGYERQLLVVDGVVGVADHSSRFNQDPITGCWDLLNHADVGLIQDAPLWFLFAPAFLVLLRTKSDRHFMWACLAVIVFSFVLFAPYDGRHGGSTLGNRFMFPALACGFALIGRALTSVQTLSFAHDVKIAATTTKNIGMNLH